MNKTVIIAIGVFFILISVMLTAWQRWTKHNKNKEKYQHYVAASATITMRMPGRVTRYGAKPARYTITFKDVEGKMYTTGNCELGENYKAGDTLTIYYNPSSPTDDIITHK